MRVKGSSSSRLDVATRTGGARGDREGANLILASPILFSIGSRRDRRRRPPPIVAGAKDALIPRHRHRDRAPPRPRIQR